MDIQLIVLDRGFPCHSQGSPQNVQIHMLYTGSNVEGLMGGQAYYVLYCAIVAIIGF